MTMHRLILILCAGAACYMITAFGAWPVAAAPYTKLCAGLFNTTMSSVGNTWVTFEPAPAGGTGAVRARRVPAIAAEARLKAFPGARADMQINLGLGTLGNTALAVGCVLATPLPRRRRIVAAIACLLAVQAFAVAAVAINAIATLNAQAFTLPDGGAARFIGFGPTASALVEWLNITIYRTPVAGPAFAVLAWATAAACAGATLLPPRATDGGQTPPEAP